MPPPVSRRAISGEELVVMAKDSLKWDSMFFRRTPKYALKRLLLLENSSDDK